MVRLSDPVGAMQILGHCGVAIAPPAERVSGGEDGSGWGRRRRRPVRRLLVIGQDVVAVADIRRGAMATAGERVSKADRALARRAAKVLGLRLAAVDVVADGTGGRAVARVTATPDLSAFERVTQAPLSAMVIAEIEARSRSWVRHEDDGG
jgi:hypothetical protein